MGMMPGFNTYSDIVTAQRNGNVRTYNFFRVCPRNPFSYLAWQSLWFGIAVNESPVSGDNPAGAPGGTTYVNSPYGMTFPNTSPARKFITKIGAQATQNVTLMIYDRLVTVSGCPLNVSTNVNTATVPRYNGAGVQAWIEQWQIPGGASAARLHTYTNQDGVTGRAGSQLTLIGVTNPDTTCMYGPLPLQAGDTGVRSVQVLEGGNPSSPATMWLTLLRPLAMIPLPANVWIERDLVLESMLLPEIEDGATLCMAIAVQSVASATIQGQVEVTWA